MVSEDGCGQRSLKKNINLSIPRQRALLKYTWSVSTKQTSFQTIILYITDLESIALDRSALTPHQESSTNALDMCFCSLFLNDT